MDIYINDEKLGNLNSGEAKGFSFVPRHDGKNTIRVNLVSPIDGRAHSRSKDYEILVHPGGLVKAVAHIEQGWSEVALEIDLAVVGPPAAGAKCTLKIERSSTFLYARARHMYVYVNEEKLGSLNNGEAKAFAFQPRQGKNLVRVTCGDSSSKDYEIVVPPGGVVEAIAYFKGGWGNKHTLEIDLTAASGVPKPRSLRKPGTISFTVGQVQFNIPTRLAVLCGVSGLLGGLGGVIAAMGADYSDRHPVVTGVALGLACTALPVLGWILCGLTYGTLVDLWASHCDARRRRWKRQAEEAVKHGYATKTYQCGVCGKPVSEEDYRRNTCSHCGVHWNFHSWGNPPPWGSPRLAAAGIWFCLPIAFLFGFVGFGLYAIILLVFSSNVIRDASLRERTGAWGTTAILFLTWGVLGVAYYATLYGKLGLAGVISLLG